MFLNLKNEGEMFQTKVVAVTSQSCNLKQNVKTQLRRICVQLLGAYSGLFKSIVPTIENQLKHSLTQVFVFFQTLN